jgi:hypothetical protein
MDGYTQATFVRFYQEQSLFREKTAPECQAAQAAQE